MSEAVIRAEIKFLFTLTLVLCAFPVTAYLQRRLTPGFTITRVRNFSPIRKKPTREQRLLLEPLQEDKDRYASLLAKPGTGIVRLLPDLGCESSTYVVRVDETCRNAVPGGPFFSFRENEHTIDVLSDIRLNEGILISDGILSQGLIVGLGNVSLESVNMRSPGMDFLQEYVPEPASPDAHKQSVQITNGINRNGFEYRSFVRAAENATFGMRIIAYRGTFLRSFQGVVYDILQGDERIDLTLAFRVVRMHPDGGVTLIWTRLEERDSPKLIKKKKRNDKN